MNLAIALEPRKNEKIVSVFESYQMPKFWFSPNSCFPLWTILQHSLFHLFDYFTSSKQCFSLREYIKYFKLIIHVHVVQIMLTYRHVRLALLQTLIILFFYLNSQGHNYSLGWKTPRLMYVQSWKETIVWILRTPSVWLSTWTTFHPTLDSLKASFSRYVNCENVYEISTYLLLFSSISKYVCSLSPPELQD